VGPHEESGEYNGIWVEQWLWAHRNLIRGIVLDMSTPRYLHEWIYELPTVEKVLISDLCAKEVEKMGHKSKADIIGDFCAVQLPVPEESFDTVLCISILEHCEDPFAMVRNISRLLRPGGVAFFQAPFAYIDGHMGNLGPDYWRFGRDGYLLMARKASLEVLETGQFCDIGRYFILEYGWSAAATSWHRGVPTANWMICQRPK
jgi:SAM-dependent methyltransferase